MLVGVIEGLVTCVTYRGALSRLIWKDNSESVDRDEYRDLQFRIEELLKVQDDRLTDTVNSLSLGNPGLFCNARGAI